MTSYIIQNIAVYRGNCLKNAFFSRKFGKIAVHRGIREKSRLVAVNGKNRYIATNYCLWEVGGCVEVDRMGDPH